MANKVEFGLSKVYVALITDEATATYGTPTPIPGAVTMTLSPEGTETPFYADDSEYFTVETNNGYSGTLEFARIPDSVLADLLGWEVDANGMIVEVTKDESGVTVERTPFALLYEVGGDSANRRYAFYKCLASRPEAKANTKTDTTDVDTQVLNIKALPIEIDDRMVVKSALEYAAANASIYNAWYTTVQKPVYESA